MARISQKEEEEEEEEDHMSTCPPTVILGCFVVRIWLRLDSNRSLHDFLAMDYYPYNRKIMKACDGLSLEHLVTTNPMSVSSS